MTSLREDAQAIDLFTDTAAILNSIVLTEKLWAAEGAIAGYICRYRKALYFGSLGISLYLELFCFLSFISFVLRKLT